MSKRRRGCGSIHRRGFFRLSAGAAAIGFGLASCGPSQANWRVLSADEVRLLEALGNQIIPEDKEPGGGEAGFPTFVDRQLNSYYGHYQERYRSGLQALEETCRISTGQSFLELDSDGQRSLLEAIERNEVPEGIWTAEKAGDFFSLIVDHCMQSFYGSPRHGGNRHYAGFRTVGLEYPQILPRAKGPVT